MDEVRKIRLVLTATIMCALATALLTAFALLVLSLFWTVPLWKASAIIGLAGVIGGGAALVLVSERVS